MSLKARLLFNAVLFLTVTGTIHAQPVNRKSDPARAAYISLDGHALAKTKAKTANSHRNNFGADIPVLQVVRTKSTSPKGSMLLLPGEAGRVAKWTNETEERAAKKRENEVENMRRWLSREGFDVVVLEAYPDATPEARNLALGDVVKAFRLLKEKHEALGLHGDRLGMMGWYTGGYLAARAVQQLDTKEQPDDLLLINPSGMNETLPGTVFPAVMPPLQPKARLFVSLSAAEKEEYIRSCREYTKTWIGYDGSARFHLLSDSGSAVATRSSDNPQMMASLKAFLHQQRETQAPTGTQTTAAQPAAAVQPAAAAQPEAAAQTATATQATTAAQAATATQATTAIQSTTENPAAVPVQGYSSRRHREKLAKVAKEKFDLIWIGNSITNNFEKPEYQPVWQQFFAPRKALNLGYSGYRTENIIWNLQNGELEGQTPKLIVLEIGTNNIDEKNYLTRHTAGQLAGGIEAIVTLLREKCPDAKIIVLRAFPGCYGGPNPTSHRAILERASDLVSRLADGKHVFYCDVNHVFLNTDGSINKDMMPDWLHPSPEGSKAFARAMEPLVSALMGDESRDTEIPSNTAIVPVPKLEEDSYNWWDRHAEVLRIKDTIDPEIVLIGNSITHFWGGLPQIRSKDGKLRKPNGPKAWDALFHDRRVLNLGFGWDRTQNVLWRLDRGELDGIHPRTVIIHIGTNNTSETKNARMNTASEIVEGIRAICGRVRSKTPQARIILMAVFPREQNPDHPRRILINEINHQLAIFAQDQKIVFVDIGPKMLAADGSLPKEMANDFCHPTEEGYQVWADAIEPYVRGL